MYLSVLYTVKSPHVNTSTTKIILAIHFVPHRFECPFVLSSTMLNALGRTLYRYIISRLSRDQLAGLFHFDCGDRPYANFFFFSCVICTWCMFYRYFRWFDCYGIDMLFVPPSYRPQSIPLILYIGNTYGSASSF